jgi:fructose-1-phosphate kinase PfkB-like protein
METENTETQENGKENKKFDEVIKKLIAVVGGKEKLKVPKKVPNDLLGGIVNDLFKEERESALASTKEDLKNLLKKYAEMEKLLSEERKKIDKLEKEKKEEFAKAANSVFEKIENVGEVEKSYYNALKEVK